MGYRGCGSELRRPAGNFALGQLGLSPVAEFNRGSAARKSASAPRRRLPAAHLLPKALFQFPGLADDQDQVLVNSRTSSQDSAQLAHRPVVQAQPRQAGRGLAEGPQRPVHPITPGGDIEDHLERLDSNLADGV
jgi:hypothetical protein